MDYCHMLLLLVALWPDKSLLWQWKNNNYSMFPLLLHPRITLVSTNMMLGLPLASLYSLLCPEWHYSLRRAASLIYGLRYIPPERMSAWGRRAGL